MNSPTAVLTSAGNCLRDNRKCESCLFRRRNTRLLITQSSSASPVAGFSFEREGPLNDLVLDKVFIVFSRGMRALDRLWNLLA
jgi:hypothetical protein